MAKRRFTVSGNRLLRAIEELVQRGDVRRVCLLDEQRTVLEIPLNVGDPAAPATSLRAPVIAAIRAFSTLVNECTVEVETTEPGA
jgi:hypothetical protein